MYVCSQGEVEKECRLGQEQCYVPPTVVEKEEMIKQNICKEE